MTIQPGDFWIADIRFTDRRGSKKRPVLVLWLDGSDLVAAAVTSMAPRSKYDVPVNDWTAAGLRQASTVRLSRVDYLEQSLLTGRPGTISGADAKNIKQTWTQHVQPQF